MSDEDGSAEKLGELLDKVLSLKTRGQYDQAIEILDEMLEREGTRPRGATSTRFAVGSSGKRGGTKRRSETTTRRSN